MNYQKEMEKVLKEISGREKAPSLLLHSCCAPCSSYVLEYLSNYFRITVLYYNPNIAPEGEYGKRIVEQNRLIDAMPFRYPVRFMAGLYEPEKFYETVKGLENVPEGGERCFRCYALRLEEAARLAQEGGYDFFTTTLSISPLKKAQKLNEIGFAMGEKYGVSYLPSDFKKKEGYKRSIELSRIYNLYRQDYCGCVYSKAEREREKKEKEGKK